MGMRTGLAVGFRLVIGLAAGIAAGGGVEAAESAASAYILGLRGAGAGVTPPEGLFFSNQIYMYNARIRGRVPVEGGLQLSGQAKVKPLVNIPTLIWMTPIEFGGARLGTSVTVPFGRVSVSGNVGPLFKRDSIFTVADPSVGLFLGGRVGDFRWQTGVTAFLPIGDYRKGELANVSKNRGALDVYGALTWLEPTLGLDITNVVGVTFNRANPETDYKTGNEFHWEWAVTKKFESGFSVGAVGYVYRQLTADSGRGAALGAFKGSTSAIGAAIGYDFKVGQAPISTKIRFYHEMDSERRLKGNSVFLSFSMPLWVPGAR
jgi:hypothetical protein